MPRWPSNFAPGIKTKFKNFNREFEKKVHRGYLIFHQEAIQKLCLKIQRFHKTYCYFGQNPKRKGSISPSNFDEEHFIDMSVSLCGDP